MKKILICDDDLGISEVIKIILDEHGYITTVINNGEGIKEIVSEFKPNLVLLDLWLPGVNGKAIVRFLKKDAATKSIPVVVVSALSDCMEIAQKIGADDCLCKPFEMQELVAKVKKYTS